MKISIPSSMVPTIESLTASPDNPSKISSWGIYVQAQSKALLKINGAKGIQGSTITGYTIKGGGFQGNSASFTTGVLNSSGEITFTATVTDSRGRKSAAKTVKISVVAYKAPVFSKYSAVRCIADGTPNDEGTCVLGNITFSYSDCSGKNKIRTSVHYRVSGTTSWTDAKKTFESGKAFVFGDAKISAETSYDLLFAISDAFGTVEITEIISTAAVLMDFKAGGTGIAVGKVSEHDKAFEVNPEWTNYFYGKELQTLIKSLASSVVNSSMTAILEKTYPVGSIYLSISATNPGSLFGGTWVQISQGRFLLGESTSYKVGATGGEATHKLTANEMPSHNHRLTSDSTGHSFSWGGSGKTVYAPASATAGNGSNNYINTKQNEWASTQAAGGNAAHNNMPPYYVCYMWRRIK